MHKPFQTLRLWAACLCLFLGFAGNFLSAQGAPRVTIVFDKKMLVVEAPPGAHLKKSFMKVALKEGTPGTLKVTLVTPPTGKDELGEEIWNGPVQIKLEGEGLSGEVPLAVSYQPCTEGENGSCFPPTTKTILVKAADIPTAAAVKPAPKALVPATEIKTVPAPKSVPETPTVSAAPVAPESTPVAAPAEKKTEDTKEHKGIFLLLLIAFAAGLGASLTPCVYPMIPITMAIIGAKGGGKARGFTLSLALVLGMAVTYTTLGVLAAKSGATFGSAAQSPWFLIPVSVLFAVFALSLFGVFEMKLPDSIQNKLQGNGPRQGYAGAFIMGLVLGPLAAPCVGPIVATILLDIAKQGQVALGGLQLFVFSLGMGVLFMLVGTFSAGLPRSGNWLIKLKEFMGVVILGFAAWNVRLLAPEWLNNAMWALTLLVLASVLGVFKTVAEGLAASIEKGLAVLFLVLSVLLGIRTAETAFSVQLLPRSGGAATLVEKQSEVAWIENDLEKAQEQAKASGKPVLIDTYTSWCAQCKELDHKTWPDAKVVAWIQQHAIPVRIECEKGRPDLAKRLEIMSYPTIILMDASGKELRRANGFMNPDKMLAWLQQN